MNSKKYLQPAQLEQKIKTIDFNVNQLLKHQGYRNKPLNFDQAYLLGAFTMAPYVPELAEVFTQPREKTLVQSVAALCTFHNKATYQNHDSAEQIAGICAAIFDYDIGTSSAGYLHPTEEVMDNCGMGGDLFRTPNLSTLAALVASADGVNLLKHGSPGNTDDVGSSDFLAHCGVNLFPTKELVEQGINNYNFGYTDALDEKYKRIHSQTHRFAHLAHMNDIIGPITNPVHPRHMTKRVLGINHLIPPERVAQAYLTLNQKEVTYLEHGLFIRGFADKARNGGIDEVSIMPGGTRVAELKAGQINTYDLYAKDFGLEEITVADLNPGKNKAETSRQILSGEVSGAKRDAVLANTAILFYLAQDLDLKESTTKARALLASGKPYRILVDYAGYSRGNLK